MESNAENNQAAEPELAAQRPARRGFDIGERAAEIAYKHGLTPEVRDAIAAAIAEAVGTRFQPGPEIGLMERMAVLSLPPELSGPVAAALADFYSAGLDRSLRAAAAEWRRDDTVFAIVHEDGFGYRMQPVTELAGDPRTLHVFHARDLGVANDILVGFYAGASHGRAVLPDDVDEEPEEPGLPQPATSPATPPATNPMISIGASGAPATIVMGTFVVIAVWFVIQIVIALLRVR